MRNRTHGQTIYRQPTLAPTSFNAVVGAGTIMMSVPLPTTLKPPTVDYMFKALQADPESRLPETPATAAALEALGRAMTIERSDADGPIPAAYTYFGQFIDHDITKTAFDPSLRPPGVGDIIADPNLKPLPAAKMADLVSNVRTLMLDLESVYEGDARGTIDNDGRFRIGQLTDSGFPRFRPFPPPSEHTICHASRQISRTMIWTVRP